MPARAAGDVAGFHAVEGRQGENAAVKHAQGIGRGYISPGNAFGNAGQTAKLADDAEQIARKTISNLRRSAGDPPEIGVQAVTSLLFENSESNSFSKSPCWSR